MRIEALAPDTRYASKVSFEKRATKSEREEGGMQHAQVYADSERRILKQMMKNSLGRRPVFFEKIPVSSGGVLRHAAIHAQIYGKSYTEKAILIERRKTKLKRYCEAS